MVAKVISGKDIKGALNYNELKVLEGKATLIQASGFIQDAHKMNFYDKLNRLGKSYSASAILERLSVNEETVTPFKPILSVDKLPTTKTIAPQQKVHTEPSSNDRIIQSTGDSRKAATDHGIGTVLNDLITANSFDQTSPEAALRLGRKKRKKKGRKL